MAHPDRFYRLRQSTTQRLEETENGYTIREDNTAKHIKELEPESKTAKEKCV